MQRYLVSAIAEDLKQKMVFVGGPRQVGKTTLARQLAPAEHGYLNWGVAQDRSFILQEQFPTEAFVIFDEVHKFHNWRNYLKGLFDVQQAHVQIIVTGSARLDYYRHSGDSLQGRYFYYRLHPFTAAELGIESAAEFDDLLRLGGFPEPCLSGSLRTARRWIRDYRSRLVYEDITSLELSQNLSAMEQLLLCLPARVGSPLSINALREDLNLAHKTVAKWLDIFERMYQIYRLPPFRSNKLRALKKVQKHYHYNWAEVEDEGARFENLIAGHLLKWVHLQQDTEGRALELCYFRDVDHREVDFIIVEDGQPITAIECKLRAKDISPHLKYFKAKYPDVEAYQVYYQGDDDYLSKEGIRALNWQALLRHYC